ncbi:MAG TPA: anti-sigma factor [Streptosporangiaceae bacterium]
MRILHGRKEPHTLAGAYAMDALEPQDRARFEHHLTRCDACSQEVSELREATARLALATSVSPPSALKEQVIAAARSTRQHAPVTIAKPRLTNRRVLLIAAPAAAGLIAVATVFGLANSDNSQQLGQAQQRDQAIAAVMTARDATMMSGRVAGGGTARIVMSHQKRALVFMATGLPALPASASYELWLVGPGGDRPAGMLPAPAHGMTGPVIASGLRQGDHLMLTVEPAAGTAHPTTRMMLDIPL